MKTTMTEQEAAKAVAQVLRLEGDVKLLNTVVQSLERHVSELQKTVHAQSKTLHTVQQLGWQRGR